MDSFLLTNEPGLLFQQVFRQTAIVRIQTYMAGNPLRFATKLSID
ncbi:hypothetical protein BN439_2421 [Erwinia amylovora Ea644]|nr:hypothetical protein BN439_2421 [Erwinia amylovora Ea644]CCP07496.1 hypothetical protein BN440_2475 [Erwinia amylovora MR1]